MNDYWLNYQKQTSNKQMTNNEWKNDKQAMNKRQTYFHSHLKSYNLQCLVMVVCPCDAGEQQYILIFSIDLFMESSHTFFNFLISICCALWRLFFCLQHIYNGCIKKCTFSNLAHSIRSIRCWCSTSIIIRE